jgi:hypothetical protein
MHVQRHTLAAFRRGRRHALVSVPVWTGVKSLSLRGFEPPPVHPVASCFTDYTGSVTLRLCTVIILIDSWHLLLPCLLVYDTRELNHLTSHTWKEVIPP